MHLVEAVQKYLYVYWEMKDISWYNSNRAFYGETCIVCNNLL